MSSDFDKLVTLARCSLWRANWCDGDQSFYEPYGPPHGHQIHALGDIRTVLAPLVASPKEGADGE